jgi:group I intron endonuclease
MYGIIYKAASPSGKVYIGQTVKALVKRKAGHKYQALKEDRRSTFQRALLDEGFDSFVWEEIDTAESPEELNEKEIYWIANYRSDDLDYGYNNQSGGIRPKHAERTKQLLREKNTGRHHTEESRRKISEVQKGRIPWNKGIFGAVKQSEETKKKHSLSGRGKGGKLTETDVIKIKKMLLEGACMAFTARLFNVSLCTVSAIKHGRNWSWVNAG